MTRVACAFRMMVVCVLLSRAAWSTPVPYDIVDVPVTRLISNTEQQLAKSPKDPQLHYVVARLYAIRWCQGTRYSYARNKGSSLEAEVVLGNELYPPAITSRGAVADLKKAVSHYRAATFYRPDHLPSGLGYGWTLQQIGRIDDAKIQYVTVFKQAYDRGEHAFAVETGNYLLPLLDPQQRALFMPYFQKVQEKLKAVEQVPHPVTPIMIPLGDDSFDALVDLNAAVPFDMDGFGVRKWQWITPKAGWLVYRGNGRHPIDSGLRLVGARTFWVFWEDGYAALSALDDNQDGSIEGAECDGLAIWHDINCNGHAEPTELHSLHQHGIRRLTWRGSQPHPHGFPYHPAGVVLTNGRTRPSYDWITHPSK